MAMERRVGSFLVLLGGLAFACVSGGGDDAPNNGPECYSNAECTNGHECSGGICVGYYHCDTDEQCRNNQDCLDGACRIPCTADVECEDDGLICANGQGESQHCAPAPNPTRGKTQTMSGSGGTGSTGSAGAASMAGRPAGTAGAPTGIAGAPPAAAGAPAAAGGMGSTTAGRAGF